MASQNNYSRTKCPKIFFFCLCLLALQVFTVEAQQGLIARKFLKIIPGISTRTDVEKVFPITKSEEFKNFHSIDFDDGELAIGIEYSTGKCGDSVLYDWNPPEWTVVGVSYDWPDEKKIRLSAVITDFRKFHRNQRSDVVIHVNYTSEESGIDIVYNTKLKSVQEIYIKPSAMLREKYVCP